jgi:hypothetical protein
MDMSFVAELLQNFGFLTESYFLGRLQGFDCIDVAIALRQRQRHDIWGLEHV